MSGAASSPLRARLRGLVWVLLAAGAPLYWSAAGGAPGQNLVVPDGSRPPQVAPPGMLGILTGPERPEITGVVPASPAQRAGLLAGDRVVTINGIPVDDARQIHELIGVRRAGERVVVRVSRGGELFEVGVVLQSRPRRQVTEPRRRSR